MNEEFFDIQTDSSRIKANIVANYFPSYCKIINRARQDTIVYLDLFSGPGVYKDGSWSTPMLIGDAVAKDEALKDIVLLMFNDNAYIEQLKNNFHSHFPQGSFKHPPRFGDKTVGDDDKIKEFLIKKHEKKNPRPTLLFFDPWGYKGIDTKELSEFLQNWGNEIFLFVNIKRIHAAIQNDKFDQLMALLFPTTIEKIKHERRYKASVHERLSLIIDHLANEFKTNIPRGLYHTAFKFQEEDSSATSHYIIHFTKHPKGYELVKQTYYNFDNIGADLEKDGTYTFDAKKMNYSAGLGFDFTEDNLKNLSEALMKRYTGRTITARKLFEEHQINTKYCATHYAKTLRKMVENDLVEAKFIDQINHKVSVLLIDQCILRFN